MIDPIITTFENTTKTPEGTAILIAAILFAILLTWIFLKGAWKALMIILGLIAGTTATYYALPNLPPDIQTNQIAIFMGGALSATLIAKLYKPGPLVMAIIAAITGVCYLQTI